MDATRLDTCELIASIVPAVGLSLAWCSGVGEVQLPGKSAETYAGHSRVIYSGTDEKPEFPPRIIWTEVADLDERALNAFDAILSTAELASLLAESGRYSAAIPFDSNSTTGYVSRQSLTEYAGKAGFYRPLTQRQTELTGVNTLSGTVTFVRSSARQMPLVYKFLHNTITGSLSP